MKQLTKTGIVIIGAGNSQRMGVDKIFAPLAGKPLLTWTVDVSQQYHRIDQIAIVLNENNINSGRKLVNQNNWSKVVNVVLGGRRRQDSVKAGISSLKDCDWIIIQDAARPFLTIKLLNDGLRAALKTGSAVSAVPVKDTIKQVNDEGMVDQTLQRQFLWAVQTPQVFRSDIIMKAYELVDSDVTDDASIMEKAGYKVMLYMGSYNNVKITTPEDMATAEVLARSYK
jgi:2-C-methyl-D-erythritol 4-phosphate cytidylyltransferase